MTDDKKSLTNNFGAPVPDNEQSSADMSKHTRAHLFGAAGRRTPALVRFSTVGGEKDSADADRDPRGWSRTSLATSVHRR
jgi:catalase